MIPTLLLALSLGSAAGAQATGDPGDAFVDAAARTAVERARERMGVVDRSIRGYRVLARERISVGMTVGRAERVVHREETVARVRWLRDGPGEVHVLAARETSPALSGRVRVPGDLRRDAPGLAFDPSGWAALGRFSVSDSTPHPLAPGSEAHYRYRSGDTTSIRLAGGRTVRLVELRLLPRRAAFELFTGSLWLDAETHDLVRAVIRPSRPFSLSRDAPDEDVEDVPAPLRDMTADAPFITLEYALWEGRFWLPRVMAFEGVGGVGAMVGGKIRFERTYEGYEVTASEAADPTPLGSAGTEPARCTKESGKECVCGGGRCGAWTVHVPADTASLLSSPELAPSIFAAGESLLDDREMKEIERLLEGALGPLGGAGRPEVQWAVAEPELLRYNRVEGLSVGARASVDLQRAVADATARLGVADLDPGLEVGLTRAAIRRTDRVALYRRLEAVRPESYALGFGSSVSALLLGRDDGEYFRAMGAEVLSAGAARSRGGLSWRLFAERQSAAGKGTDWSVPRLFGAENGFRENITAETASQVGGALGFRSAESADPLGLRWGAEVGVEGSTGTFSFAQPSATVRIRGGGAAGVVGLLEAAAGTTIGTAPVQSLWYLGGPATVRGYGEVKASGDSYWRARGEVATAAPGARLALFSDAGWAGARDAVSVDPTLLSAGVGASFLDGLLRIDLSRALRGEGGWRLDLYLDGGL